MNRTNPLSRKIPKPSINLWEQKFNALCYEVFFRNTQGKELLEHMELKYFRSPVAMPGQPVDWAFFNEGRNELIRSFTNAIQKHINESNRKQNTGNKVNA